MVVLSCLISVVGSGETEYLSKLGPALKSKVVVL